MLRVLTLSTLFPDATRPNFGVFVERQTAALAALAGVSVQVVAPLGLPPAPLDRLSHYAALTRLPRREEWHGLAVERPRFTVWPRTGGRFHAGALTRALIPVLEARRGRFDVIDASFFFPDGPAAVALGRRLGVPVSIKARGADIHAWGTARATRAQVAAAGRAANGLLAVSEAMADDVAALGMPRPRVHRTGVDQARFRPAPSRQPGPPRVVALGALIPRKGHDVVIRAVADLPQVHLTVVGEGPERGRLERLVADLGIADRVVLAGSVAHGDLPALLAQADVMALASASEGLANAWVEALSCGTPVVVTDAGGARELVRDSVAGQVAARDPAAFARAIAAVLAAAPSRAAVRATVSDYSWERNALTLRDHLAGLVSRSAP